MNILLTNDDGVQSEGLIALANALSEKHNIVVLAPDGNRSASSHSLSIFRELTFSKVETPYKYACYSLSGTPCDCVKFAIHYFKDIKFDLVISGINAGENLGSNTSYSGTVAAALEGNFFHIPSIAFSCVKHTGCRFQDNAEAAIRLLPKLMELSSPDITLNVNFPNLPLKEIAGAFVAPLGYVFYNDYYRQNSNGSFSLMGEPVYETEGENDVALSSKNYITVTPILFDRTDKASVEKYSGVNLL